MSKVTNVGDLKVGDIILDGIASRVDAILPPDNSFGGYSLFVTDGNGYSDMLRLAEGATVTHFDEWTPEDWEAFRAL